MSDDRDADHRAGDDARAESAEASGRDDLTPPEAPRASEVFSQAFGQAARRAGLDPSSEASTGQAVWSAIGGVRGIFEAVLPSLAFLLLFTFTDNLVLALTASVGLAVVFTALRLIQRSPAASAFGGLVATGFAAALALFTGRGADNFVPGLVTNGLYGTAFLVSALIGWSIVGLAAGFLMSEGTAWRDDHRKRRVFFWLALAWATLFYVRLAVQLPLYLADNVAALGTVKLLMGIPLFAPLVAVTWLVVRAVYRTSET